MRASEYTGIHKRSKRCCRRRRVLHGTSSSGQESEVVRTEALSEKCFLLLACTSHNQLRSTPSVFSRDNLIYSVSVHILSKHRLTYFLNVLSRSSQNTSVLRGLSALSKTAHQKITTKHTYQGLCNENVFFFLASAPQPKELWSALFVIPRFRPTTSRRRRR